MATAEIFPAIIQDLCVAITLSVEIKPLLTVLCLFLHLALSCSSGVCFDLQYPECKAYCGKHGILYMYIQRERERETDLLLMKL